MGNNIYGRPRRPRPQPRDHPHSDIATGGTHHSRNSRQCAFHSQPAFAQGRLAGSQGVRRGSKEGRTDWHWGPFLTSATCIDARARHASVCVA